MVCRIAASLAYETFIRPFYLRHIPQTVIVILKSIIELNGIHAFKYFSSYHATKVAIIFHLGASTAYTYHLFDKVLGQSSSDIKILVFIRLGEYHIDKSF